MSEQETLFRDIPHARATDPGTSHASGTATEHEEGTTTVFKPGTLKHEVLLALRTVPRSAHQIENVTGRRGIWKRVSDCKNALLVEPAGIVYDGATNRDVTLWRLTRRGRDVMLKLDQGETVLL